MKALGLNPGEQEMIDMTNEVNVNGLIYYPDFCKIVLRKYREENREVLNQALFKVGILKLKLARLPGHPQTNFNYNKNKKNSGILWD